MKRLSLVLLIALIAVGGYVWSRSDTAVSVTNSPAPAGPIVAFGDSLTAGKGATPQTAYPAVLARLIGRPVLNAGVPGDTIEMAARRLDRDVLARHPGMVIVLLGGNDLLRQKDLDASFDQLRHLVVQIQSGGAMVVLVGLESPNPLGRVGWRYRDLARQTGCLYVPDILGGLLGHDALMSDGVHPNAEGYAKMAERIAEALAPHLGQAGLAKATAAH